MYIYIYIYIYISKSNPKQITLNLQHGNGVRRWSRSRTLSPTTERKESLLYYTLVHYEGHRPCNGLHPRTERTPFRPQMREYNGIRRGDRVDLYPSIYSSF